LKPGPNSQLLIRACMCTPFTTLKLSDRGARKLRRENLKVVWAEFSTLSKAVLQNVYNLWAIQTRLSLDLKTRPRYRPYSLSLSMF
jgi:hypothetical protein